jgi:hypothetical protein
VIAKRAALVNAIIKITNAVENGLNINNSEANREIKRAERIIKVML